MTLYQMPISYQIVSPDGKSLGTCTVWGDLSECPLHAASTAYGRAARLVRMVLHGVEVESVVKNGKRVAK